MILNLGPVIQNGVKKRHSSGRGNLKIQGETKTTLWIPSRPPYTKIEVPSVRAVSVLVSAAVRHNSARWSCKGSESKE